jgi:CheY-like chemotaxis protein
VNLLILVVDDEPDVEVLFRQQFRRDLRAGRFTMEFAQSAPTALQRITDAAGVSLILILSDINMPGMSGLELLPKAKALRPDVPVIMITAYGDAETKRNALERGAEALLTKPIDFGTLRSEIDMRVERAAQPGWTCKAVRMPSWTSGIGCGTRRPPRRLRPHCAHRCCHRHDLLRHPPCEGAPALQQGMKSTSCRPAASRRPGPSKSPIRSWTAPASSSAMLTGRRWPTYKPRKVLACRWQSC